MAVKDHLGKMYGSVEEMCAAYKMPVETYNHRRKIGASIEVALTVPVGGCVDHLGKMYGSVEEMCAAYGIPVQVYKHRRERKASIEVSLTTPYKGCVDHLGNVYKHLESMCGAYGIPVGIYKRRRENGLSLEEALCTPIRVEDRYPVQDHKGNRYSSIKEMCKAYGIPDYMYNNRRNRGLSVEEALCSSIEKKTFTDFKGNEFNTQKDMLEYYGIRPYEYKRRIKEGWSQEKALCTPDPDSQCADHIGRVFNSVAHMCKQYGIDLEVYKDRRKLGYSIEEALSIKEDESDRSKYECVDHTGFGFNSVKDMCLYYGVDVNNYKPRRKTGWTVGRALVKELNNTSKNKHKVVVKDHLNREYNSVKDLCEAYGIPYEIFYSRAKNKWDKKDILEKPVMDEEKCSDSMGNKFNSTDDMCKVYGIDTMVYRNRIRAGWDIVKALTTHMDIKYNDILCIDHYGDRYTNLNEMLDMHGKNGKSTRTYIERIKRGWSIQQALETTDSATKPKDI